MAYTCIYDKGFLLRCTRMHHFKSDLINNMDHIRITGNEPSSLIFGQNSLKSWKVVPNEPSSVILSLQSGLKVETYIPKVPKKIYSQKG